jgi:hypothetical protein
MARTDRNLLWHSVLPSHHDMHVLLQKISLILSTKFTSKYTQPVVLFFGCACIIWNCTHKRLLHFCNIYPCCSLQNLVLIHVYISWSRNVGPMSRMRSTCHEPGSSWTALTTAMMSTAGPTVGHLLTPRYMLYLHSLCSIMFHMQIVLYMSL